jgi:glycosyltransferase involved in cell wall biosynthesis
VSRIQVLYVHHRPQLGGAPLSLAELIRSLDSRFEPHVYLPAGPAAELLADAGADVHTGPVAIFGHTWDNPYDGRRWLLLGREALAFGPHARSLRRLLERHRFSIVHPNDSVLLPAGALAKRAGAAVVWHLRSSLAAEGPLRQRAVLAALERWGDAAIAIDSDVARSFPLRIPVQVVPNAVARIDAPPASLPVQEGQVKIGLLGFLRRQKGWPQLLEAVQILTRQGLPVQLVVVGGGVRQPVFFQTPRGRMLARLGLVEDEETVLRARAEELGITDRITILPFTTRPESILSALDLVVFPNQGLGLGRPVLEAATYGKPAVASGSPHGGGVLLPEVTGILLDRATPDALALALGRLVGDLDLRRRMGEAAANHARSTFDPDLNARAVEAVYRRLSR